jgi:hypothetical protein
MNIREDFGMETCGIISLNQEQIREFFGNAELGETKTVTMVYDQANDIIILNAGHDLFEICNMLATAYLLAEPEKREQFKVRISSFREEVKFLDKVILMRQDKELGVAQ